MVAQSTAVSISVSSTGFTVTWSGSSADVTWYVYIYYSTTSTGTYTILTSANYTTASETGDTKTISYSPVGTYYYKATVTTGGGGAALGSSLAICTAVQYAGLDGTSTINLTMSCLSTIFSTYGGASRGYHLGSYSSIRFSDGSYGPTTGPVNMSSFLNKAPYVFTPLSISTLIEWYKGDVGVNTGYLTWANQGTDGGSGTLYGSPTTQTVNTITAVRFPYANEDMYFTPASHGAGSEFTFFAVLKLNTVPANNVPQCLLQDYGNGFQWSLYHNGSGYWQEVSYGVGGGRTRYVYSSADSTTDGTTAVLYSIRYSATYGTSIYVNNTSQAMSSPSLSGAISWAADTLTTGQSLDNSYNVDSALCELLVYPVGITDSDATAVRNYLMSRWSLAYTLSYTASQSVNIGTLPVSSGGLSTATLNLYTAVQTFELKRNGASQSPAVYLTVANSSSRTLSLSGDGVYSVYSTTPDNTTVLVDLSAGGNPSGITYTTTATVAGTMTSVNNTFTYSYTIFISTTGGPPQ